MYLNWVIALFLGAPKKQDIVTASTTDAEYVALSSLVRQTAWYGTAFTDLQIPLPNRPLLLCDNQSSIKLAENPVLHDRSKHIEVHYHFTRERLRLGLFSLQYVPTAENAADLLTKALSTPRHREHLERLRLMARLTA